MRLVAPFSSCTVALAGKHFDDDDDDESSVQVNVPEPAPADEQARLQ